MYETPTTYQLHFSEMSITSSTKVVLCCYFTESCFIEVSLVIKCQADVDEESVVNLGVPTADMESRTLRQVKNCTDSLEEGVVGLCPPVRICILPKPAMK
jgi:hypothetical protein